MESVTSADGQQISYWRSGEGPPVVLVHGAINDRVAWILVHPLLEKRFTVYAMNRRGREGSGPPAPHTFEQEVDDLIAVLEAAGEPVHLVGHSGGAICSLGAVLRTDRLRSLTLYEPPAIEVGASVDFSAITELVHAGKNEEAALLFFREGPQVPESDLDLLRASPIWQSIVDLAPTMPHEFEALVGFDFNASHYQDLSIPLLLLVGADSPPNLKSINQSLRDAVPAARYVEMPGQQHGANLAAPQMFVDELTKFFDQVAS